MTGLSKAAVARIVALPEFPEGTWLNARVVLYPKAAVEAFLSSGSGLSRRPARARVAGRRYNQLSGLVPVVAYL